MSNTPARPANAIERWAAAVNHGHPPQCQRLRQDADGRTWALLSSPAWICPTWVRVPQSVEITDADRQRYR